MFAADEPIVDWAALFDVVWTSFVGGIGVTAVFAFAILSATRTVDLRRGGESGAAGIWAVVTGIASAFVMVAVIFGIVVMTHKS